MLNEEKLFRTYLKDILNDNICHFIVLDDGEVWLVTNYAIYKVSKMARKLKVESNHSHPGNKLLKDIKQAVVADKQPKYMVSKDGSKIKYEIYSSAENSVWINPKLYKPFLIKNYTYRYEVFENKLFIIKDKDNNIDAILLGVIPRTEDTCEAGTIIM